MKCLTVHTRGKLAVTHSTKLTLGFSMCVICDIRHVDFGIANQECAHIVPRNQGGNSTAPWNYCNCCCVCNKQCDLKNDNLFDQLCVTNKDKVIRIAELLRKLYFKCEAQLGNTDSKPKHCDEN